jgi:hypothetical protein
MSQSRPDPAADDRGCEGFRSVHFYCPATAAVPVGPYTPPAGTATIVDSSTVPPNPTYKVPLSTVEHRASGCVCGTILAPATSLTRSA